MTDVLELLKDADPADAHELRGEAPPRDTLAAIIASTPPTPARPRRRGPVRLLAPAAAVAAASVAAVLLVPGGGGRSVESAAAAALERIADVARAQPPTLPPGDRRFLYFRLESKGFLAMDHFRYLLEFRSTQESWVGERNGLVRNVGEAPTFAAPEDRRAWEAAGRPKLPEAYEDESPTNSPIERLRIPTDPDALLDYLRARAARNDEDNEWIFATMITDYLREWGVTPDQRAALYEAAAMLPGVELLGKRTDPAGREGTGFAMDNPREHMRNTLIVDPDTAELLAQVSETLPGGPIRAGMTSTTVFHSPVLVESAGELP
jgi:hypothetical protein